MHTDGTKEAKTFAPGYGEFYTGGSGDVETLALAVPAYLATGPLPAAVSDLGRRVMSAYDAARRGDWAGARRALDRSKAAWRSVDRSDVPRLIRPVLRRSLERLDAASRRTSVAVPPKPRSTSPEAHRICSCGSWRLRRSTWPD